MNTHDLQPSVVRGLADFEPMWLNPADVASEIATIVGDMKQHNTVHVPDHELARVLGVVAELSSVKVFEVDVNGNPSLLFSRPNPDPEVAGTINGSFGAVISDILGLVGQRRVEEGLGVTAFVGEDMGTQQRHAIDAAVMFANSVNHGQYEPASTRNLAEMQADWWGSDG